MIIRIMCADCGKEITPHLTNSLLPDEIKVEISTCTCRIVNCEDCEDLEIAKATIETQAKKLAEHEAIP